jgi:hypothetical protein
MRPLSAFFLGLGIAAMISAQTWGWAVDTWKVEAQKWQKIAEINGCRNATMICRTCWRKFHAPDTQRI